MNKIASFLFLIIFVSTFWVVVPAPKAIWKLFGNYGNSGYGGYGGYGQSNGYGQNNGYGSYYPQPKPRYNYGRSNSEGGGSRYNAICRVHAGDAGAFPGRVFNPVCPY